MAYLFKQNTKFKIVFDNSETIIKTDSMKSAIRFAMTEITVSGIMPSKILIEKIK